MVPASGERERFVLYIFVQAYCEGDIYMYVFAAASCEIEILLYIPVPTYCEGEICTDLCRPLIEIEICTYL